MTIDLAAIDAIDVHVHAEIGRAGEDGLKPEWRFYPNDRAVYPLYEVVAEAGLPALFHTGHSGMGSGLPGGGGIRLKYSNPMYVDDVAVDFPEMPIILAHPSFPVAGGGDLGRDGQGTGVHRPFRAVPEAVSPVPLVCYANTILAGEGALRLRLPGHHARALARETSPRLWSFATR